MLCGGGAWAGHSSGPRQAGCQAPAPGEAAPARNRTPRTQASRAWRRKAPGPDAGPEADSGGLPLLPLPVGEARRRGCGSRIPNGTPSSDQVGASTCYQGPRGLSMGTSSQALPVPRGPPRRPATPWVRTSRLPAQRRRPCPPATLQGSQRRGRACERGSGRARRPDPPWRAARSGLARVPPGLARPPPSCALGPRRLQDGSRER